MTREEKRVIVDALKERLTQYPHFYIVEMKGLNAGDTSTLRRQCFEKGVELVLVKNTLFRIALEEVNNTYVSDLTQVLNGTSSVFFSAVGNMPARVIKDFRNDERPLTLKAAYVEESLYVGDGQLSTLATLKSREELIANVVALLQSPAQNLISALQSGSNLISGVVKTLESR